MVDYCLIGFDYFKAFRYKEKPNPTFSIWLLIMELTIKHFDGLYWQALQVCLGDEATKQGEHLYLINIITTFILNHQLETD